MKIVPVMITAEDSTHARGRLEGKIISDKLKISDNIEGVTKTFEVDLPSVNIEN